VSVAILDEHSTALTARLSCRTRELTALQDISLDWSTLDRDLFGRELEPAADIGRAVVYLFPDLSVPEIAAGLVADDLPQSSVGAYGYCTPESTGCSLSDFNLPSHYLALPSEFEVGSGTWLFMLERGDGEQLAALLFAQPVEGGGIDSAVVRADDCELYRRLRPGEQLRLPARGSVQLDWSGVRTDVLGQPVEPDSFDLLRLMFFQQAAPAVIAESLFTLPEVADGLWALEIPDQTALGLDQLFQEGELSNPTGLEAPTAQGSWWLGFYELDSALSAPELLVRLGT